MNTIRTTEKILLKVSLRGIGNSKRRGYAALQTNPTGNNKIPYRNASRTPSQIRYSHQGSKMRMIPDSKLDPLKISNTASLTVERIGTAPFFNPNKLNPEQAKAITIQPVSPLTHPRFDKSDGSTLPSVTRVLQATMPAQSRLVLERWRKSMIKKLGIQGFNKYTAETFARGTALHSVVAHYMMGNGEPEADGDALSKEIVNNLWNSIKNIATDKISNVRLVEHTVTHKDLGYRGIVDCVAMYENELVVIDFKTAEKQKGDIESLYDNPLQVAAYCAAINNDPNIPDNVIDRNVCSGLVIVAYTDGSEASTYYLKQDVLIEKFWRQWTNRLDQYVRLEQLNKTVSAESKAKSEKKKK